MQTQDFAISRLSQMQGEQKTHYLDSNQSYAAMSSSYPEQYRKQKHIPLSKLSFKYVFVKKQSQKILYQKQLPFDEHKNAQNQFYQIRKNFQEDISTFLKTYKSLNQNIYQIQQSLLSPQNTTIFSRGSSYEQPNNNKFLQNRKKAGQSLISPKSKGSKKTSEGGYFFNNWRSYQSYYCSQAISLVTNQKENLISHLVYSILDMDYKMSLKIIDKINQLQQSSNKIYVHANSNRQSNKSVFDLSKVRDSSQTESKSFVIESETKHQQIQIKVNKQNQRNNGTNKQQNFKKNIHSHELTSLKIILKGLKTLCSVIKATDQFNQNNQLAQTFFNRQQFNLLQDHYTSDPDVKINLLNITHLDMYDKNDLIQEEDENQNSYQDSQTKKKFGKKPSYNLNPNSPKSVPKKTMKSAQNIINYKNPAKKITSKEDWKKFLLLQPLYQKICVLNNLMFLINFSKKIKIQSCHNDYFRLIFSFLKNGQDQLQNFVVDSVIEDSSDDDIIKPVIPQSDDNCSNMSQSSNIIGNGFINFKKQIDYSVLLLQLKEIKIYDRINFATRLLSKTKKVKFVSHLQSKVTKFAFLDNLLLFTKFYKEQLSKSMEELSSFHCMKQQRPKQDMTKKLRKNSSEMFSGKYYSQHQLKKQKQKSPITKSLKKPKENQYIIENKIKAICQNYVDEYGDLATIAYLSSEYPCLSKFRDCYRESLLLSYEQEEVENLDALKQKVGEQWNDKKCHYSRKFQPFLSQINYRQQKVNEDVHEECLQLDSRKCQICNLKINGEKKEAFIECGKCKHGGHFEHILKWYSNYQNCPNVNCACLCN